MTIRQTPKAGRCFSNRIEPLEQRIAPATFVVTTVADSGAGSLRQAILSANGAAGVDLITFNLGTGPFKILPLTQLPDIIEAVTIDGYSQSGASVNSLADGTNANIIVELSGESLPNGNGLILGGSGGSIVRGLAIFGFGSGINETGNGIILKSSNNRIEGNFIGTDASGIGRLATDNKNAGVRVGDFSGSTPIYSGNIIGGTNLSDRNLLTGNAFGMQLDEQSSGTLIVGNLIGLNKDGNMSHGNFQSGIADSGSSNTQIGNGSPNGRNVISGNTNAGILQGSGTGIQIRGNYIGTNAAGSAALGNAKAGVEIVYGGSNGLIEGNVISGNGADGVSLGSSVGDGNALNFNVRGNFIGTNLTGMQAIPNVGAGLAFYQFAGGHTIGGTGAGQGNVIAFNGGAGIEAFGGGAGNRFLGNSISKNGGLGINHGGTTENYFGVTLNDSPDVDGVTNWPQLQTASNSGSSISLNGVLNAQANRMYRVEFFALAPDQADPSGYGEGAVYLGFQDVTSNASGVATITYSQTISLPGNTVFSATATPTVGGSTSEFGPVAGASTNYTWNGTAATDWFNPSNWTPNGVPGVLDIANIGSGTVIPTSPVSVKALNFTGGSLGGTSEVNVLGTLAWSGGTHLDGTLRVIDGATATVGGSSSPVVWTNGTLENHGSITVQAQGVNFNQGVLTNDSPGALMTLLAAVNDADGGATAVSLSNQGTIQKQGTGAFGFGGFSVSNAGTLRSQAGTLVVGAIQQTSGLTELAGGSITSAGTVQIIGGDLVGAGTITGNVQNDSRIFIAGKDAAGTLTIAGNYTQFSNGVLVADLGGLTAGTGYDKLTVTGSATLSGTLETNLLGTFVVRAGNSFNILAGTPVSGTFTDRVGAPPIPVNYTAAQVTLIAGGFTVTNTNDSGAGSLRQAILDANAQSGLDYISFNIPGGGLKTISPLTVLPSLSGDTVLDAYSQPGASVNTLAVGSNAVLLVELSGASVPNGAGDENGLSVSSSKSTISGFIINRWTGYGVAIEPDAGGSSIVGNWIGTNSTGSAAPVNSQFGILIDSAPDVRIGSAAPRDRNVISGNDGNGIEINGAASDGTIIQGNYIGTTKTGTAVLGNRFDGVYTQGPNTVIGGDKAGEGNVISGSLTSVGILINLASASGSSVMGNLIGTDASGTLDFGNADSGVVVLGSANITIGGTSPGAGNVIIGNGTAGIQIAEAASTGAVIEGNFIGTDKTGTLSLGNDEGIFLSQASGVAVGGIQPGAGNVIANNIGRGIVVFEGAGTATGNTIRGNAIYGNGALGIDLVRAGDPPNVVTANDPLDADTGANGLVNFPSLSTFVSGANPTVTGTYSGLASSSFNIDVYSSNTADPSGNGEGRYFLGTVFVTTNSSGAATFTVPLSGFIPGGGVLTATATHGGTGSTSEFSPALATVVSTIRTWDAGGGADTNWFTALNWTGDMVPGAADTAELLSNFTVTLNAPVTIANFTQADGTVTGGGSMTITSGFMWTKGTFTGPSTLTIAPGATATLSGPDAKVLDRRFLDNQGTVLISGGGALQFKNGPLFTNSGVLEFQSDSNYQALDAIGATFTNSGSVRKTGGTGSSTIGLGATTLTINNTGTLDAESGILGIAGGGTFSNAALITKPGTSLRFGGGTTVANGTTTISGDGTLALSGHTLNVSGTVNQNGATSLSLGNGAAITSSGTWQIGGDGGIASGGGAVSSFTIGAGGVFRKSGGNGISIIAVPLNHTDGSDLVTDIAVTSGTLRLIGGGTWDGTDPDVSAGATMEIAGGTLSIANRQVYVNGFGAVRMTGGTLALVSNSFYVSSSNSFELSGGLVNAQSSEELLTYGPTVWSGGDINSTDTGSGFQSYGVMVISGAANRSLRGSLYAYGATTLSMTGAIQLVDDSAIYTYAVTTISGDGDFTHVGAATAYFANLGNGSTNGILRKADAGTTSFAAGIEFSASGRLELNAGTIAMTDLAYLLGTTVLQGGTIIAAGGLELSASVSPGREGILTGTGLITGNFANISGTIRPGGTGVAGTITIAGNYTQNAAAKLSVDLGGAGAGQFDVLSVTGTANIDGVLDVAYFNGYVPAFGDTLTIVPSAARTGAFASISGAGLLTAAYTATQARLVRNAVSFAWDGGAGTSDWFTPQNWNPDFVPTANDNVSLSINSTINLPSNVSVASYTQSAGSLNGAGNLTVTTAFNWTGGQLDNGGGKLILPSGSVANLSGGPWDLRRTVDQAGTLTISSGADLTLSSGAVFNNTGLVVSTGTNFTIEARSGGGGTFRNLAGGTFRVTGTGQDMLGGGFDNNGAVDLAIGADFRLGTSTPGSSTGGTWTLASGSQFTFDHSGATYSLSNASFSGAGTVRVQSTASLGFSAATTTNFNSVSFSQSGGTLVGPGTATMAGATSLTNTAIIGGITLNVGGTLANFNGGLAGGSTFNTSGTSTFNGGFSFADASVLNNTGALTIPNGAIADFINGSGGGSIVNGTIGSFTKLPSGNNTAIQVPFTNSGAVAIDGSMTFTTFTQSGTAASIALNGVSSGAWQLNAGTFSGTGTHSTGSVTNAGATVRPGGLNARGTLHVNNYEQQAGATLEIEIAGTGAGQFDVLDLTGASTLGGGLSVDLVAPFNPSAGNTFRVVTGGPSGNFTTFTGDVAALTRTVDGSGVLLASTALTYVWDDEAGDGDWFNPINWDLNSGIPGAVDTAVLSTSASINLNTNASIAAFVQSAGTIAGGATLSLSGGLTWSGGTIGVGLVTAAGSVNTLGGGATMMRDSALMELGGSTSLGGTFPISLTGTGAEIRNTGAFEFTNSAGINGSGKFHNFAGSSGVTKSGVAEVIIDVEFLNGSPLAVNAGTLSLAAGGSWLSGLSVTVASLSVLNFSGGTHDMPGSHSVAGAGRTRLSGGTLDIYGTTFTVASGHTFELLAGGTLDGDADFVIDGAFNWLGGTAMGFGGTTIRTGGAATVTGLGTKNLDSRTLTVDAGAALDVTGDGTLQFSNGAAILVDGSITISSAAPFFNGGGSLSSIEIRSGGTFDKTGAGAVDLDVPFANAGSATFSGGLVNFRATYTQTAGFTALAGGAVGFSNPAEFQGGTLRGSGDITGSINNTGAIVSPGNSPGQFVIEGDYIQGPSGLLRIEIQGSSPGAYDALMISGSASIDGDLEVTVGVITPLPGQAFTFISAASVSGTFASVTLPSTLKTIYAAGAVSVRAPFLPPGLIRLSDLNGTDGLAIPGLSVGGNTGASVAGLGDINGDGLGDFVIGAPGETLGGVSYVIFGSADPLGTPFDLSTLNGANGFSIVGGTNSGSSGFSVSSLGDLNGDGVNEILVGDPELGGDGPNVAAAYVVFGKTTGFASTVDLSLLDGTNGFRMVGVVTAGGDRISVASAGDLNNDGATDIIVGMPDADFNGTDSGVIYVVFGIGDPLVQYAPSFDLAVLDGTNGFRILGQAAGDAFGAAVSTARDINRDGFGDIIIGAPKADGIAGTDIGAAYVFFGKNDGYSATIDLASLNGKTGFKTEGKVAGEKLGSSVSSAGDMNGDGFGDIVVGALNPGNSGAAYVAFGKASGFKPVLDLNKLTGANGFRLTTATEAAINIAPSVSSVGDFNNDGFDDILVGTPFPESDAGITYLLFGRFNGFAPELDLETLNATTGFRFVGPIENGQSGASVSGGTDINNDGFDDIIIGAPERGNQSLPPGKGGAYVIYGHATQAIPTVSASGTSATFSDVDGDIITVKVTGGKITADMLVFGPDGGLLLVDLTAAATLKDGANLTFSVRPNGGNGTVNVGAIDAGGLRLGSVKVTGDLGQIDAGKGDPLKPALKSLTVGSLGALGDTTQIPGTEDPLVSDLMGSLPKVTVKGNFTNATFNVLGKLGSMTVNGAFSGTGAFSSSQIAGLAALGHGQIGHVAGGTTLASSGLSAGSIGSLNIKGGVTNSAINSASGIGSASITGDFNRSAIVAATSVGVVKVVGKLIGDATTPSVISARGKLIPKSQGAAIAINSLTVKGDVEYAEILMGYDRTFTALNGDASIGKVTVNGNWKASSLVAGIKDETDNGFGLDDVPIPGFDATAKVFSRIASLIIKGTAEGSADAGDSYAITAQQIVKAKIHGSAVPLDKLLSDNRLLEGTDDFRLVEVI